VPIIEDGSCGGIEGRKGFHPSWHDLFALPVAGREEKMSSIPVIVWKLIEILLKFPKRWSRLGKGLEISIEFGHPLLDRLPREVGLSMGGKRSIEGAFFQGKVGFRNIMEVNSKTISGSPSFFLPCQIPLNLSSSQSHPGCLSSLG
jgi:hypothetical protein